MCGTPNGGGDERGASEISSAVEMGHSGRFLWGDLPRPLSPTANRLRCHSRSVKIVVFPVIVITGKNGMARN